MKLNFLEKLLGSGFYTGYIPFASGTWGSLIAFLIYWFFIPSNTILIIIAVIVSIIGIPISTKFENVYGKDPSECTIDELAGTLLAFYLLPKTLIILTIAFILWRIIDIIKPFGIRKLEELKGGLGIMADDIAGGILTCVIMNIGIYSYNYFNINLF